MDNIGISYKFLRPLIQSVEWMDLVTILIAEFSNEKYSEIKEKLTKHQDTILSIESMGGEIAKQIQSSEKAQMKQLCLRRGKLP